MKNLYRTLLIAGAVMMTACGFQMRAKADGESHSITVNYDSSKGTASVSRNSAVAGENITITATPAEEYYYDGYTVGSDSTKHSGTTFTMLDENVELHVIFTQYEQKNVFVTVSGGGGSATATSSEGTGKARRGQTVTLTATPEDNYEFDKWESDDVDISSPTSASASFRMPDNDVSVTAKFKSSSNSGVEHTITVNFNGRYGRAYATPSYAREGRIIYLFASPDYGYFFDRWTTGDDIEIFNSGSLEADFRMIDHDVTVIAHFKEDTSDRNTENKSSSHHHSDPAPASSDGDKAKSPDGCDELRSKLSNAISDSLTKSELNVTAGNDSAGDGAEGGNSKTIYWNEGTSLPYDVMKTLQENPDLTLIFSFEYQGKNYVVTIPGSSVVANPAVEWYGPVYLYTTFESKKTSVPKTSSSSASSGSYTVKRGDSLSKIAKRLGTTVKKLKEQNNLTNVDKIKPGMVLKYGDEQKLQEDKTKTPGEANGATPATHDTLMAMQAAGADLMSSEGFERAANAVVGEEQSDQSDASSTGLTPFAQFGGSSMRAESG